LKPEVLRFTETGSWVDAFASAFIDCAEKAADSRRPAFHAALSGGTTPAPLYRALAASLELRAAAASIPMHFWVVDEREVPAGDSLRNGRLVEESLAGTRAWPHPPRFHLWPEGKRGAACAAYAAELEAFLGPEPAFDVAVLGMGADGHTAGLFTVGQVEGAVGELALATEAPAEPRLRMTLAPTVLRRSKAILVALSGPGKAGMLDALLGGLVTPLSLVAGDVARFYYLEA
jgi:6-phosphogluconolactonase